MTARVSPVTTVTTLPLSDLDEEGSKLVDRLDKTGGHVVLTRDGEPVAVLMSPAEYDELTYRVRFMKGVVEGLADVEAGRVHTSEEIKAYLEKEFGPIPWQ
jgi:prevent-host-death family protein